MSQNDLPVFGNLAISNILTIVHYPLFLKYKSITNV